MPIDREHGKSLDHHPMRDWEDFPQIRKDVQFGRISWPIGIEIVDQKESDDVRDKQVGETA